MENSKAEVLNALIDGLEAFGMDIDSALTTVFMVAKSEEKMLELIQFMATEEYLTEEKILCKALKIAEKNGI